jgi:hypothetical protein
MPAQSSLQINITFLLEICYKFVTSTGVFNSRKAIPMWTWSGHFVFISIYGLARELNLIFAFDSTFLDKNKYLKFFNFVVHVLHTWPNGDAMSVSSA